MSTSTPATGVGDGQALEPRARGTLTLSDGVVEKIASQVVDEVSETYATSRGLLGWRERVGGRTRPTVEVDLHSGFADLRITVGLAYPVSLRSAADTIRDRVQQRVTALTGVQVRRVDVRIDGLQPAPAGARPLKERLR